jgi:dihydroneopterin aldolase
MISIIIKNLEFETIIGVLDFEKITPQKVIINCKIKYKYENKYLDYAKVTEIIKDILTTKKFEVIEDSLNFICSYLKNEYPSIKKIKLEILKPNILKDCIVGAKIIKKY